MRVILAQPRGFCAGVVRAIEIVEQALEKFGPPVYVRHEIVHNRHVVEDLKAKGVRFVEELSEVPRGAVTIFSAHGISRTVEEDAGTRGLIVLDAVCPLVAKVHHEGQRYIDNGRVVILVGHTGHPEIEGTMGQLNGEVHLIQSKEDVDRLPIPADTPVAYITQTTLSVDDTRATIEAIKRQFKDVVGPETRDICYATQNRQTSVRELARLVDLILVVGASNSSNSNRLREVGSESGVPSYLIADGSALRPEWFEGKSTVGLTAGASAPEVLVDDVIAALRRYGPVEVSTLPGIEERSPVPHSIRAAASRWRFTYAIGITSMGIPFGQAVAVGSYILRQHLAGRERYPLVLMLEPLFRCNLACAGCGKIDYPEPILDQRLSVADCMQAIDECGAPVVVLAGGEPLLHPELPEIVRGALAKRKYVTVCTNALLLEKKLHQYRPNRRFNWSVHLDGDKEMHDRSVCRAGVYNKAVGALKAAKAAGFRVNINCTLFSDAVPERVAGFFDEAVRLGVSGITVSPGYAYERAPDQQHFLNRAKTKQLFRDIFRARGARKWPIFQSPTLPRLPCRQPDLLLHAVGQPHAHGVWLAAALLSARRRLRQDVR